MVYPKKLNYKCEKCKNDFSIHVTPKYTGSDGEGRWQFQKSVSPVPNVRCPECGAKAHYVNQE